MRGLSVEAIMATLNGALDGTNSLARQPYDGVIEGFATPQAPRDAIAAGAHNAVPLLIGAAADENGQNAPAIGSQSQYEAAVAAFLGLGATVASLAVERYPVEEYGTFRDAYVALTSDAKFTCTARRDAELFAGAQGEPVFHYIFDDVLDNAVPPFSDWGAFHGLDTFYTFGTVGLFALQSGPSDVALAQTLQGYWTRFAATGDPNGDGAAPWEPFTAAERNYVQLSTPLSAGSDYRAAQCDFWDALAGL
jgi:para-nitrobenzyl esterase